MFKGSLVYFIGAFNGAVVGQLLFPILLNHYEVQIAFGLIVCAAFFTGVATQLVYQAVVKP